MTNSHINAEKPVLTDIVLSVRNLTIEVPGANGPVRLVDDVSFDVRQNEVFGIVGESGSGKSITMLAVLGLLAEPLKVVSGSIKLRGKELSKMSFADMRAVRGKSMAIVFQDPMTTLNPVLSVGKQIGEAVRLHNPDMAKQDVKGRVVELLTLVGIPNPEKRYHQFPNEFSGGMRQRVVIAIAMANEPDLLIADEPTTALDVTIQAQVMSVLAEVRARTKAAMVLITHDLGLVAETADRMAVMYGGRMMETSPATKLFSRPDHPYTAGLIASLPRVDREVKELYSISGFVPDLANRPSGCVFHPRCAMSNGRSQCREQKPALQATGADSAVACHFSNETADWRDAQEKAVQIVDRSLPDGKTSLEPILKVEKLRKEFQIGVSLFGKGQRLNALRDISFELPRGRTLGLVGESGCGKSTLARVLLRLLGASGGDVYLNGEPFTQLRGTRLRNKRRDLQVVFQDPYSSLDPRMTIHEVIAEPLRIHGKYSPERINELLAHVGLTPDAGRRRPPEFSGGQRQRIAIARALALHPDVLILDEAVSALDVSIQAQIINLLKKLQDEMGLTYVFISHDLSVVRHISDEVAVMYLGRIVEHGSVRQVFDAPAHPYTQALLSSIPRPDATHGEGRIVLKGDLPNPLSPPSGCAFRTRCFRALDDCAQTEPELKPRTGAGHLSACLFPGQPLQSQTSQASLAAPAKQASGHG
ncbi:dipeptide ABC transporter ATP-binding protein [Rhizobium sp. SGZ-381]|uniref:ABC transporter ATP-binding protein n=1 Tax=Rhizobium sp. SGZ-381 TaxID=3342800 RepID=UPI0036720489